MKVSLASCHEDGTGYPTAEAWVRLARETGVRPARCVAVTSSARACKSALAVNMRCAVVPDVFTGCQDFGGADIVSDTIDDDLIGELLAFLEPL
jgi:beta-phosphoglucomutase-like phosphatase (HAD superfamily)